MNKAIRLAYLNLLIDDVLSREEEIDTLESYLTEENFDVFAPGYFEMRKNLSAANKELDIVRKELGMSKKKLDKLILSK